MIKFLEVLECEKCNIQMHTCVITGVAKGGGGTGGPRPPPPLLIGELKKIGKKGKRVGNWTMPIHKLPLIMAFNVQENAIFIHKFSKNLPTVGGGNSPTPSPRSVASLPRFDPPMTNPGCIAKDTSPHAPPPLIGTKEIFKRGVEDCIILCHFT